MENKWKWKKTLVQQLQSYVQPASLSKKELRESDLRLKTYTGQVVKPKGVGEVEVIYKEQKRKLFLTVVEGNVPTLLGRDWLERLGYAGVNFFHRGSPR